MVSTSTVVPVISSTMPYGVATYPGVILGNTGNILNNINMGSNLGNINRNDTSTGIRSNAHHHHIAAGPSMVSRSPSSSSLPTSSFNFKKPEPNIPGVLADTNIYRPGQYQPPPVANYNPYQPNKYGPSTVRPYYPAVPVGNGGQQQPPSRIYHPNHPSQITSTQTPWWRPHHPKIRDGYERPVDQSYHYNKKYKGRFCLYLVFRVGKLKFFSWTRVVITCRKRERRPTDVCVNERRERKRHSGQRIDFIGNVEHRRRVWIRTLMVSVIICGCVSINGWKAVRIVGQMRGEEKIKRGRECPFLCPLVWFTTRPSLALSVCPSPHVYCIELITELSLLSSLSLQLSSMHTHKHNTKSVWWRGWQPKED